MTGALRILPCLDVRAGRLVKGVRFHDLVDRGDPTAAAVRYESEGADEIVLLDIAATRERRGPSVGLVRSVAAQLSIPLTVGGGIGSVDTASRLLGIGADKVSVNSAALRRPALLKELAREFGRQCVVAAIDARRRPTGWAVRSAAGTEATPWGVVDWAQRAAQEGAGEFLITSIDRDGTRTGYDRPLYAAVRAAVAQPLVASGGCGRLSHILDLARDGRVEAILLASLLHEGRLTISRIKRALGRRGCPVRPEGLHAG
ncbi:MAG: imidazole glycerol phosphate synthase subunit HisF [Thermoplasmata archaeon]